MARWHTAQPWRRLLAITIMGILSTAGLLVQPVEAGKLDKLDTSLSLIPQDASFYTTMLRNREQIEAIAQSRAWASIEAMPVVQMAWQLYQAQTAVPGSVPAQIEKALEDPQTKELVALLGDMVSNEVFLYGDTSAVDFIELMQRINSARRFQPAILALTGRDKGVDANKAQAIALLNTMSENLDLINVPDVIVGFKLTDTDRATAQLKRLEVIGGLLSQGNPLLKDRFKPTKVGGHDYLVLSLDGNMVPWDEVPLEQIKQLETTPGEVDKLIGRLQKLTLVVAIGLRDDYLLVSIGSSTESLAGLGQGKRLIDAPEMQPLEQFADERLASIGYASKAFSTAATAGQRDIDDTLKAVDKLLPLAELDADKEAQIRKDVARLADDLVRLLPTPGAATAFSFLTDQGVEGYRYNWGGSSQLDGSKPLGLLKHVGGRPLLAVVSRSRYSPEAYDLMVNWAGVALGYFEQFGLPEMPESDREKIEKLIKLVRPLAARADKANRQMLMPATADSQAALVIDARLSSKQFFKEAPATEKAMPMVEPALVMGLSDGDLFKEACIEYREIANAIIEAVREVAPDAPDWQIPDPEVAQAGAGTVYFFPLPAEWGVDEQIAPSLGLSDKVAVIAASPSHAKRLLAETPLEAGGVLSETDRPLAMAVTLDWARLIDAATPWIDLATREIVKEQLAGGDADTAKAKLPEVADQVHTVLKVLKVVRTVTSESYFKDGALVTHTLTEIRDID